MVVYNHQHVLVVKILTQNGEFEEFKSCWDICMKDVNGGLYVEDIPNIKPSSYLILMRHV